MPEISLAEDAPGESASRLDPRTKLLALLVLNALVMRASPTSTLLVVQLLAVLALLWEVSGTTAARTGLGCLVCDAISLGSPLLVVWLEAMASPRGVVLAIGTCSAIAFWFARFFAGFGLALYVYRTTRIGQMKAALRALHLPRVFVDALAVAFRVIPTVGAEAVAIREAMEMRGVDLGIRGVLRHRALPRPSAVLHRARGRRPGGFERHPRHGWTHASHLADAAAGQRLGRGDPRVRRRRTRH